MRIRSRLSLRLRLESGVGEQSSITVMSFTRLGGGRGVYRRSSTSSHSHWKLFFIPDRSRTRGRTAELLPPRLVPTTNVWYTTPTVFHLPVINGYGILFLRAYIWPHFNPGLMESPRSSTRMMSPDSNSYKHTNSSREVSTSDARQLTRPPSS